MTNQIQNKSRNLFAFVALTFFPFLIDILLKDSYQDYSLTEDDIKFINSYKKAGYIVIIIAISAVILFFLAYFFNISILLYVSYILGIFLVFYLFFNIWLIFVKDVEAFIFSQADIKRIKTSEVKAGNIDYLFLYLPFINTYIFYKKNYTKEQEYWLKESLFLYFILSIIGIFSFFFPSLINLFYILLFFIIFRSISLLFGLDFIPDNIKELIYKSFSYSPIETLKYLCAGIYFIFGNLLFLMSGKKTKEYSYYLYHLSKNFELVDLESVLKNNKKYLFLILSYLVLVLFIVYLFYRVYYSFYSYTYFFSIFTFLSFFLFLILDRKVIFLPFLSGILKFILKKFN